MASGFSVRSVHQSRRMKPGSVFKRKPAPDLIREPAPDLIREPAPDLIRGGGPVRVWKTRQIKDLQPRFDSIETEGQQAGEAEKSRKKAGAGKQRPQCVGRLHGQHGIFIGTSKRPHGVVMQRSELHPLNRAKPCNKSIGLADGRNGNRLAIQFDLECRLQRRLGA
jgi:hypothetical protein